jgi:ATP-dependent RNA helicase DBP3
MRDFFYALRRVQLQTVTAMTALTVDVTVPLSTDKSLKKKKSKKSQNKAQSVGLYVIFSCVPWISDEQAGTDEEKQVETDKPKKRKHEEDVSGTNPEGSEKPRKKDKKRKREEQEESVPATQQKVKEDEGEAAFIAEEGTASDKKSSKKDKRKRKHAVEDDHPVTEVSSKREKKMKKNGKEASQPEGVVASSSGTVPSTSSPAEIEAFLAKHAVTIHSTTPVTPIVAFNQLDVPEDLRASCSKFNEPTPIQACTWPPSLAGLDVVGIAETGRYARSSHSVNLIADAE